MGQVWVKSEAVKERGEDYFGQESRVK